MKKSKASNKQTIKKGLFKNPVLKGILSAIAVAFFGYILLGLTFLADALYQGLLNRIVGLFVHMDMDMNLYWYPPLKHVSFMVLICVLSYFILRTRLSTIVKAIYTPVPFITVFATVGIFSYLATVGIFSYQWPIVQYLLEIIYSASVLYYLHINKKPWLYYFAVIFFGLLVTVFTLLGGEI